MRESAIRHLAACDESSLIAAAFFESRVQIWRWETGRQLGEFETILDFGGRRLVLAAGGSVCVTGSWNHGLAGYSVPDGACLWKRPDLRQIQLLTLSPSGEQVNCGFETGPLAVIDSKTGATLKTVRNAVRVFSGRFGCDLIENRKKYHVIGENAFEIPALSFGLLDAALSPESVCISEPKTGIHCVDLASAEQLWRHASLGSNHLAFCTADYNFYCVALKNSPPHDGSLVRLAPSLMDCDQVAFIGPCWEAAFSQSGTVLVTMRGDVYQTSTGHLLNQLDFPQRDYPDK